MKWITRAHPKIDRLACPWLIRRFIDKEAEIIYAPFEEVMRLSQELGAIPFDVPGVEFTHYGKNCTFDYFIQKYELKEEALQTVAVIVRGADTDHHELSPQSSGLWAISAGLAHNYPKDNDLLEQGMVLYDALYSWASHLQKERHTQQPSENLLLEVYNKFLKEGKRKKTPEWAQELKEIIQDHIDASLTLKELSKELEISPSYLSREFSKHFEQMSFGDYIRKLRIEKSIELMKDSSCSFTEIAYLTGFSDQSHFNRIFKKHTGEKPSVYRKKISKK